MQGYFLRGMKTGLIVAALAIVTSISVVTDVQAAPCGTDPSSVAVDVDTLDVLPGGSVDYAVTITHDTVCDMTVTLANDKIGFSATPADASTIPVVNGDTVVTLIVSATKAVNIGTENITTLTIGTVPVAVTTAANNPLLHNSYNLNSGKWSTAGGWGVKDGKYDEFGCATCHGKKTGNIKRVKADISFPDNSTMPNGTTNSAVLFLSTTGANSFGDDTGGHASSNRICEVCHTYSLTGDGVTLHAFSMASDSGHENNNDCIGCHQHKNGFRASCSSCHGDGDTGQIWPDEVDNNGGRVVYADDQVGAHDNHILAISQELYDLDLSGLISDPASTDKQKTICAFCHPDPGGGGHDSNTDSDDLVDMQPAGSFEMFAVGANTHAADTSSGAYNFTNDSCSNLACHDQKTTPTGSYNWNSDWTSAPAPDCTMCHEANGGTLRHDKHVGGSGFVCTECHLVTDNVNFNTGTAGVAHVNGDVELKWDNAGSYEQDNGGGNVIYSGDAGYKTYGSGVWGTCDSVACHGNFITPAWDQSGTGCAACHTATKTSGAHEFHMELDNLTDNYGDTGNTSDQNNYDFGCAVCHSGDSHVNGSTTVTTHGFDNATKTCDNTACHGYMEHDGVTFTKVPTPAWNGPGFTGDRCTGCHDNSPVSAGHDEHQIGFHYDAVYSGFKDFLPVEDTDPKPIGLLNSATLDPYDTLRGHGGLLESDGSPTSTTMSCYVCHNDTVKERFNALATTPGGGFAGCSDCHTSSATPSAADKQVGNAFLTIYDKSKHVNGVRDVVFMREKVRSKAQVRDDILKVPELKNNWTRTNNYKLPDGSSFDESPDTLYNMSSLYGGYDATTMTCQISCHLWEEGRVDKLPIGWYENSRHNPDTSKHIMCIDCHTRLPK